MARQPTARVRIHRQSIDRVFLAMSDGLLAIAEEVVTTANPPDATPYGEGLARRGGWLAYVDGKKTGGGGLDGKQPKKPRALRVREYTAVAVAGFGFPGRFQEFGTINHSAQPFLGPAADRVAPRAAQIMEQQVRPALRRLP